MKNLVKCDRCGDPADKKISCRKCKIQHNICAQCADTYEFNYFNEQAGCFLQEKVLRHGGYRKKSGRKYGVFNPDRKIPYTTRLRPWMVAWLKKQNNAAKEIEKALNSRINKN